MLKNVKTISAMVLMLATLSMLVANGCGRKEAVNEGCPANSYSAIWTDTIKPSDSTSLQMPCGFGGGSVGYTPVTFVVYNDQGIPQNNICLVVYTDGFYYTNHTYGTQLVGEGPMNKIITTTDNSGRVTIYWSTETLPASNPVVGTTPGKDQIGTSWVKAYSGALSANFEVAWQVFGCLP